MNEKHKRYRTIELKFCDSGCPKGGPPLKIILFREKKNLRSHAVKHLTNMREYRNGWEGLVPIDEREIMESSLSLRNLGCYYYRIQCGYGSPPCNRCRSFKQCSVFVSNLEEAYLCAVEKVIKEGGSIPRYACFSGRSEGSFFCWILPDKKLIAMAILQGDTYNLMTCFSPTQKGSWAEMRDYFRRQLYNDAVGHSVIWCKEDSWVSHLTR